MQSSIFRRFAADRRGAIAVMSALFGTAALGFTALAIDLGALYLERRHLQGVADRAAMIAAHETINRERAARAVLADEGVEAALFITDGRWSADREASAAARFSSLAPDSNAVRVALEKQARLYFGAMFIGPPRIRVEAVAVVDNLAAFQIASRLLSLDGGVLNTVLGRLTGTTISLNVMDYEALADARIDLLQFVEALAASANVTAGTYDEVLSAGFTLPQLLSAAQATATGGARLQSALDRLTSALSRSSQGTTGNRLLDLGDLGGLAIGQGAGIDAVVSLLDLLRAAALAAGGDRQIALDLGFDLGPLAGLEVAIAIGEPPQGTSWVTVGGEGARVYTAQMRLRIVAGLQPILGVSARVPLIVHLASGEAELRAITCGADPRTDSRVIVRAKPGAASLWLGEPTQPNAWREFRDPPQVGPATVLRVPPLITAKLRASTRITNMSASELAFNAADIAEARPRRVSVRDPLKSALTSLFAGARVDVEVLGFDLGGLGRIVGNALEAALPPLGAVLDPIVMAVADSLGLRIGEAEVSVTGIRCNRSALVL